MCRMPKCSFKHCDNISSIYRKIDKTEGKKKIYLCFPFPGQLFRREQWTDILRRQRGEPFFKPNNKSVVCEKHFNKNDFYVTDTGTMRLCNTAVPIIDPGHLDTSCMESCSTTTSCEDPLQPSSSKHSYHYSSDTSDTEENSERIGKKIKVDTAHLDMSCEVEDNTQLTSFENPFLPSTTYPGDDYSSDVSDTNENCDESGQKIKMDTDHQDMDCMEIKIEIEYENSKQSTCCEDPLQLETDKPRSHYSRDTSATNVGNEIEERPGISEPSYPYSNDTTDASENNDEIRKKIKIEDQESYSNITAKYIGNQLDDLMSTRDNCFEKFGEYVVTMLKRMPLQKALDLQPQIVNLITSTMNDCGDGPKTIQIKTEDKLCGEEN